MAEIRPEVTGCGPGAAAIKPILVPLPQAAAMIGRGLTFIYEAISDGRIRAVKSDGRTLAVVESLHEYADSLPPAKIKPVAKRPPQRLRKRMEHA